MDDQPPTFRSVSQVLEYERCPYSYYLSRVRKAWKRPAAWFPQGIGVHSADEAFELSARTLTLGELEKAYTASWDEEVTRLGEITPDFDQWFPSGRYRGEEDLERRYRMGLDQVGWYHGYRTYGPGKDSWPATMPEDETGRTLGVEYRFSVMFGDVPVRGVIDYIGQDLIPDDNKTGNKPGDPLQLATYAGVLEQLTGVPPTTAGFVMHETPRRRGSRVELDVSAYPQSRLEDVYGEADELIRAEEFDPKPEPSKCMFCSVRADCAFSAV